MAPVVLEAYSTPSRSPSFPPETRDDRSTSGNVVPMSSVGTISAALAMRSRAPVTAPETCGSEGNQAT